MVIPVFNRPERVVRAVRSVLQQSYRDFELLLVDDGSEEEPDQARRLVEESGHKFFRTENRGCSAARNLGVSRSTGPLLAFLDSDDEWHPTKLEKQVRELRDAGVRYLQNEEIWIRNGRRVNPKKRHLMEAGDIFELSCKAVCVSNSSVMVERDFFYELGCFPEDYRVCEDYELWLRAAAKEPIGLVREALTTKYGGHPDQLSRRYPAMDRFRVAALLGVLVGEPLTATQRELALRAVVEKVEILFLGAKKRGHDTLEVWEKVRNHLCLSADVEGAKRLLEESQLTEL